MQHTQQPSALFYKLTALWAVSESGLGGILHAFKLPFSGVILGSFAVIIATFIASQSTQKFREVIQATILVLLIKAIASPHSPITAYIAVSFQGILGAILYSIFGVIRLVAIIYGAIALLESGFQKIITLTLIFGKNIWEAFQEFFVSISKELRLENLSLLPIILLSGYFFIYLLAGMIAGNFAIKLPQRIENEAEILKNLKFNNSNTIPSFAKKKKKNRWIPLIVMLIFTVSVFVLSGSMDQAIYSVLRTLGAVILLFYVLPPLFQIILKKWKSKEESKNRQMLEEVNVYLPKFRENAFTAYEIVKNQKGFVRKIQKFVLIWMTISLTDQES